MIHDDSATVHYGISIFVCTGMTSSIRIYAIKALGFTGPLHSKGGVSTSLEVLHGIAHGILSTSVWRVEVLMHGQTVPRDGV